MASPTGKEDFPLSPIAIEVVRRIDALLPRDAVHLELELFSAEARMHRRSDARAHHGPVR
ncbi:hypothetical protein ABIF90_007250 [Bradyrhizobium japonicum]